MATLGIFARRPVAGVVKTRLATTVGAAAAASFYQSALRTLLVRVRGLSVRKVIAVAESARLSASIEGTVPVADGGEPSSDIEWFQSFEGYDLWSQPPGDLGKKLAAWFEFGCATDDRVVVIGSDSPTLPIEFVDRAFDELGSADCVIGPAFDGGYYLLGLKRAVPELFEGIEWSSSRVLGQTLDVAREQNLRVVQLPPWNDVDEYADLIVLRDQLSHLPDDAVWESLRLEVGQLISDSRGT